MLVVSDGETIKNFDTKYHTHVEDEVSIRRTLSFQIRSLIHFNVRVFLFWFLCLLFLVPIDYEI